MAPEHPSLHLLDALPLIRGPSLYAPPPVELPPDIHPLPPDVTAYFVYPFSLENHVLTPHPPALSHADQRSQAAAQHTARLEYLKARAEDKERKRKDALRRVAPGWEGPGGGALEPKRMSMVASPPPMTPLERPLVASPAPEPPRLASVLDELASLQLEGSR